MIGFIHINKNAGSTLKYILRRSFKGGHCDARIWPKQEKDEREIEKRVLTARDVTRTKFVNPWLQSVSGHLVTGYSDLDQVKGMRLYTFLRDPVERTASHYQFFKRHIPDVMPFEEWIKNPHYRNVQARKIAGKDDGELAIKILTEKVSFVGMQEHFDESLVLMRKWIGSKAFDPHYKPRNVSKTKAVANELTSNPKTLELLQESNQEDIKLYKYAKEVVFPQQLADYGPDFQADLARFLEENKQFTKDKSKAGKVSRGLYWLFLPLISKGGTF